MCSNEKEIFLYQNLTVVFDTFGLKVERHFFSLWQIMNKRARVVPSEPGCDFTNIAQFLANTNVHKLLASKSTVAYTNHKL